MSAEQQERFQIRLLDGPPRVAVAGETVTLQNNCDELLAVLVLHHPNPVTVPELHRILNTSTGAIQTRKNRLKHLGIKLTNSRARNHYRLDVDPSEVDLLEFLRVASTLPEDRAPGETEAALSWWGTGPDAALVALTPRLWASALDAHVRLLGQRRKRVLIVDDKVGHHLEALLGEQCACTVVTDLAGFNQQAPSLAQFDLALVDIHLTDSYTDHHGLQILDRIVGSATDVLVIGMTKQPPPGGTREWQREHDLVEMVNKAGDDPTADFTPVIKHVRAALEAGPAAQARRLMEDFVQVYEEARTRLRARGAAADELAAVARDIRRIQDLHIEEAPLAELRAAIRQFRQDWGVAYSLR